MSYSDKRRYVTAYIDAGPRLSKEELQMIEDKLNELPGFRFRVIEE